METQNNPVGRPTKYDPSFVKIAQDYLASARPENMEIPTIEGLALLLEVDDEQISIWSKEYREFSATVKKLRMLQKKDLMITGLFGGKEINTAMAIFLLKANHGMIETSHTDITTKGDKIESPRIFIPEEVKS